MEDDTFVSAAWETPRVSNLESQISNMKFQIEQARPAGQAVRRVNASGVRFFVFAIPVPTVKRAEVPGNHSDVHRPHKDHRGILPRRETLPRRHRPETGSSRTQVDFEKKVEEEFTNWF